MGYYLDDHSIGINELRKRLQATDLIPSQEPLLDGIVEKMASLKRTGIKSVADLRASLKSNKSLASTAKESGLDPEYLKLFRRTVEGFFPKPKPLKEFDWLAKSTVVKLDKIGVKNTRQLYDAAFPGASKLAGKAGLQRKDLSEFMALADLSRVQWVSPTFARVLYAAGFTSTVKVARANPESLYEAVTQANENSRFYKGKIGLRDMKRLVVAAAYVP